MKAARIIKPKEALQVQDLETPKPKSSQVLVKVLSSGLCHSDIHLWEGGYEGPGGEFLKTTDRGVKYPVTPGHEIAGKIESIGEEAEKLFAKDDKVLVYPWFGGICPACRIGEENVCDKPKSLGIYTDGGYSDHVLVPSYRYLIKLEDNLDINEAATLSCSALTAYNAVKNAGLRPDDNLVVVGAGGLGLMAMQLAKAVTGSKIIAMDLEDEKLKQARMDGHVDNIVNSKKDDPIKTVIELTDKKGADAVIDFVNASKTVETDMQILRRRTKVVLVGLYGGELKLNLVTMPTRAYRLIGSYTGSLNDLNELVSLAKRKIIKPLVSDGFGMEGVIKLANDTQYGLGASIWTQDLEKAERLSRLVSSGIVSVNNVVASDPRVPFGGVKKSGFGRELSRYGMLEFVNVKSVRFYDKLVHQHHVE